MPSKPGTEPTLDELSAFLDHELNERDQARVAEHLATCFECQARLDGLRQTAHALRALPMETPPRSFAIPSTSPTRRSPNWVPVGWLGGAAAAVLVVVIGVNQLHFQGPATTASRTVTGGLAAQGVPYREVTPLDRTNTFAAPASTQARPSNAKTVVDARDASRSLTVTTDAASYAASGVITIHVATRGLSLEEASTIRIFLTRGNGQGSYSIRLAPPTGAPSNPFDFEAAYSIPQMQIPAPVAGSYTLQVTIDTSDHSGLYAGLPLTMTS